VGIIISGLEDIDARRLSVKACFEGSACVEIVGNSFMDVVLVYSCHTDFEKLKIARATVW
jgi:hypothetical protein